MCLAAPATVIEVADDQALVELDGVRLRVSTVLTPDIAPGDIALVHVGFVLSRMDPADAINALDAIRRAAAEGTAP